ncbi:MAG: carbohydrate kinase family protein [Erysipelotrichaceae bacterium]|nr:carbohydrate kinase family protein [Erysipelotrichaceae bacterium]
MSNIVIIGTSVLDQIMNLRKEFSDYGCNKVDITVSHGGSMRNVAENCALLKIPVDFISKFGNDAPALDIISHLNKQQVIVHGPTVDQPTPIFIKVNGNRELMFATTTPAFSFNRQDSFPTALLKNAEYGITDNSDPDFLHFLYEHSDNLKWILSAFIPHYSMLKQTEGIILNQRELADYLQDNNLSDYLLYLNDCGLKWLIITEGNKGCTLVRHREIKHYPAIEKEGNSLGCGDAFLSGIIYGLLKSWDWDRILDFAQEAALITLDTNTSVNQKISSLI